MKTLFGILLFVCAVHFAVMVGVGYHARINQVLEGKDPGLVEQLRKENEYRQQRYADKK